MRTLLAAVALLLHAAPALACPVCDSAIGQQVRANIFDSDFGYHLLMTALPFPVLLILVALIHLAWLTPPDLEKT